MFIELYVTAFYGSVLTPIPFPEGRGSIERNGVVIRFRNTQ